MRASRNTPEPRWHGSCCRPEGLCETFPTSILGRRRGPASNYTLYGVQDCPGCRENFLKGLEPFGMGRRDIGPNSCGRRSRALGIRRMASPLLKSDPGCSGARESSKASPAEAACQRASSSHAKSLWSPNASYNSSDIPIKPPGGWANRSGLAKLEPGELLSHLRRH
jgi:hypothetical protein